MIADSLVARTDARERWELLDRSGTVVGRLARVFEPPAGMQCVSSAAHAVVTWNGVTMMGIARATLYAYINEAADRRYPNADILRRHDDGGTCPHSESYCLNQSDYKHQNVPEER